MLLATKKLAILILVGACLLSFGCDEESFYSDLLFGYDSYWDPYGGYYTDDYYYDDYYYDDYYWEEEVYYDDCYCYDDYWYY